MTLLDAPPYDAARAHRRVVMLKSTAGVLFVLFVGWWLVAGRPVDWPGGGTIICWEESR